MEKATFIHSLKITHNHSLG